jgi:sulfur carrier protein ThiS
MKNFSELLATDLTLSIVINGQSQTSGLHDHLTFNATDTVIIDNIEILPKYRHLANDGALTIIEPFYCWYHRISGQGWLLTPH